MMIVDLFLYFVVFVCVCVVSIFRFLRTATTTVRLSPPPSTRRRWRRRLQVLLLAQQGIEGLKLPTVSDAFWVQLGQIDVPEVGARLGRLYKQLI